MKSYYEILFEQFLREKGVWEYFKSLTGGKRVLMTTNPHNFITGSVKMFDGKVNWTMINEEWKLKLEKEAA